ncbi:type II secretion system minor pseudopilin GspK [Idiomarina seosinensis]|nr:type II secretion system minor pseudopilin GspK [Idiomarina seosinensis]
MMKAKQHKQHGAALITVLLVVAIVSVVAVQLGTQLQNHVSRSSSAYQAEQSYWMWLSAEEVLSEVLTQELDANDGIPHLKQAWATETGPFQLAGGGQLSAAVRDLHSCFNANSLAGGEQDESLKELRIKQFTALMVALDIDAYQAQRLAHALSDFVDSDLKLSAQGAEDADYESLPLPYQTANSGLLDISELRLIRGFSAEIVDKIRPLVCVIPNNQELTININTIDLDNAELLVGMTQGNMSVSAAEDVLRGRPEKGYEEISTVLSEGSLGSLKTETEGGLSELTVNSQFFQLTAFLKWKDSEIQARSVLQLDGKHTTVIYRAMGD